MDTKHNRNPELLCNLKENFLQALNEFSASSPESPKGRENLFISYNRLLFSLSSEPEEIRNKILALIFSSLVEQLDCAPDGEISQVLYIYTFKDFLESYSEEAAVQNAIEQYMELGTLQKLPLQMALSRYRSNTKW